MLDLEWRMAGLGNLVDPLAALGCHRFSLLLKASRILRSIQETFEGGIRKILRNIQAESRQFVSYKKNVYSIASSRQNCKIGGPLKTATAKQACVLVLSRNQMKIK